MATLAGILIVVGLRMIDTEPLRFLESRAMVFDLAVVVVVIGFALMVGLIAASASGVALSILLFVREQLGARWCGVNPSSTNTHPPGAGQSQRCA